MNFSRTRVLISVIFVLYFLLSTQISVNAAEDEPAKLPIKELRASAKLLTVPALTVFMAGDGGWAKIDRDISGILNQHGMDILGFNSLQYFIKNRSPEECATDISNLTRNYLKRWNKSEIIMIGYSQGADVLPFVVSRLPDDLEKKIRMVVLLAPSTTASFKFHVGEWFGIETKDYHYSLVPEIAKLSSLDVLCFCGSQEKDSLCNEPVTACNKIVIAGHHHFNRDYRAIGERIWMEYQKLDSDHGKL